MKCLLPIFLIATPACATSPSEPVGTSSTVTLGINATPTPALATAPDLAQRYEFPLHGSVRSGDAYNAASYQGETETLLQSTTFGEVTGWSEENAPQRQEGWPSSIEEHDRMAREYLIRIGIPASELGQVHHFRRGTKSAPIGSPRSSTLETNLGYTTTFARIVDGVLVLDSKAGVQLNAKGVPVSLHIAWPAVPAETISHARALQQKLSSGWKLSPALALGRPVEKSEVVIRHSLGGSKVARMAAVIHNELGVDGMRSYRDTDEDQNEVNFMEVDSATIAPNRR